MCGMAIFLGINSALLSLFMPLVPDSNDGSGLGEPMLVMTAGLYAARFSQIMAYPFDTVRHIMMADRKNRDSMSIEFKNLWRGNGVGGLYRGIILTLTLTLTLIGGLYRGIILTLTLTLTLIGGLYRGIMMNLLKIGPSITVTYFVYNGLLESLKKDGTHSKKTDVFSQTKW